MSIVPQSEQLPPVAVPLALIANGMRERRKWALASTPGQPDAEHSERWFIIADANVSGLLETYAAKLAEVAKEGQRWN
jgi:hypothetical protein